MSNFTHWRSVAILFVVFLGLGLAACDAVSALSQPTHRFVLQAKLDNAEGGTAESENLVKSTMEVLGNRLEGAGIRTHSIEHVGGGRIVLSTAGEASPEILRAAMGRRGEFAFRLVDRLALPENTAQGFANPGSEILPHADGYGPIAVKRLGGISGKHIINARPGIDSNTNESVVNIQFDEEGATKFARISTDNVGEPFAIVLDDVVVSAPYFNEPILGGQAQISGNFTQASANELAIILTSGALPVGLELIE